MTEMTPEKLRKWFEQFEGETGKSEIANVGYAAASAWEADLEKARVRQKMLRYIAFVLSGDESADPQMAADKAQTRVEALEKERGEWEAAARYLLGHYPEDVFPAGSGSPDAKAGTFARRLIGWLLDPIERARLAALRGEEET